MRHLLLRGEAGRRGHVEDGIPKSVMSPTLGTVIVTAVHGMVAQGVKDDVADGGGAWG